MKYRDIIADNLSKAGWSWGCIATVETRRQTIFVAAASESVSLCARMNY